MIFIDTNVFMYAVGRSHPLRQEVRRFFAEAVAGAQPRLCTSAEVLQELLHPYLPVARLETLDAALELAEGCISEWWATRYRNRTPPPRPSPVDTDQARREGNFLSVRKTGLESLGPPRRIR